MNMTKVAEPGDFTAVPDRSRSALWCGRVLTGLAAAFLAFDAVIKVAQSSFAVQATVQLGFPAATVFGIGLVELVCLALFLMPRTSVLGAILWTGYLGGAIASKVRIEAPWFSDTLFPIYVAALIWGGLYLRDRRVRALLKSGAAVPQ